jgi:hypothetical protein
MSGNETGEPTVPAQTQGVRLAAVRIIDDKIAMIA